ncbi:MAG: hypothetical protein C0475_09130 [Planctomyces sp.]|nr:hypothetical protein [Planctomyces sp.]MBA4039849.1 hypothetical protein [Planctomyces sp.]MBA4120780.1 hypothetical protein [Isosphaera sp.]
MVAASVLGGAHALEAAARAQPVISTEPAADEAGDERSRFNRGDITVQSIARIEGQGDSVLRGVGIVVGLRGSGDPASQLLIARSLARFYEQSGAPAAQLSELAAGRNAGLVSISVTVPETGAAADDRFDVFVSASHSATSLQGGRLLIAALTGPLPSSPVFAFAEGPVIIEDPNFPTNGRIRGGARMIQPVAMPVLDGDTFTLVLAPELRGFPVTAAVSDAINDQEQVPDPDNPQASAPAVARALDDTRVRVQVPPHERASPSAFIARVMTASFSPSLLRLPAKLVINERVPSIVATGNVEISPVVISHNGLTIQTVTPAPVPTPEAPITSSTSWTPVQTTARPSERARIEDLLQAFRRLDLPVQDQIAIILQMHRAGRVHAQVVIE